MASNNSITADLALACRLLAMEHCGPAPARPAAAPAAPAPRVDQAAKRIDQAASRVNQAATRANQAATRANQAATQTKRQVVVMKRVQRVAVQRAAMHRRPAGASDSAMPIRTAARTPNTAGGVISNMYPNEVTGNGYVPRGSSNAGLKALQ